MDKYLAITAIFNWFIHVVCLLDAGTPVFQLRKNQLLIFIYFIY